MKETLTGLSAAGYKVTGPRRRILDALRMASGPLTAQEVAASAGTSVASTYRALALLVELGVISETPDLGEPGSGESTPATLASPTRAPAHGIDEAAPDGHDSHDSHESHESRGKRYALCSTSGHHHHFVCRACHATLDVTCGALESAFAELERERGVVVERHEVTLLGLCAPCHRQVDAETALAAVSSAEGDEPDDKQQLRSQTGAHGMEAHA